MRCAPLVVLVVCMLAGCTTKPVKTTHVSEPGAFRSNDYAEYRARRLDELQKMGGPFADAGVAEAKATADANSRYGEPPPEYSSKWAWGKGAGKEEAQAEVNETLEKMERHGTQR